MIAWSLNKQQRQENPQVETLIRARQLCFKSKDTIPLSSDVLRSVMSVSKNAKIGLVVALENFQTILKQVLSPSVFIFFTSTIIWDVISLEIFANHCWCQK